MPYVNALLCNEVPRSYPGSPINWIWCLSDYDPKRQWFSGRVWISVFYSLASLRLCICMFSFFIYFISVIIIEGYFHGSLNLLISFNGNPISCFLRCWLSLCLLLPCAPFPSFLMIFLVLPSLCIYFPFFHLHSRLHLAAPSPLVPSVAPSRYATGLVLPAWGEPGG